MTRKMGFAAVTASVIALNGVSCSNRHEAYLVPKDMLIRPGKVKMESMVPQE